MPREIVIFGQQCELSNVSSAYARVSTPAQNKDDKTSLKSQIASIDEFIRENGFDPLLRTNTTTEVQKGDNNKMLEDYLTNTKDVTLFVYDATRFVRSFCKGMKYLELALKNRIAIVFIYNKLVWNRYPMDATKRHTYSATQTELLRLFRQAEDEPKVTSMRLSQKNQYCRERFLAGTGTVPYGYNLIVEYDRESGRYVRRVVQNPYQMRIIAFIQCAREIGASLEEFNRLLEGLVEEYSYYREERLRDQPFVAYQFYDEANEPLCEIKNALSYRDIAKILNENGILYTNRRVKKWNSQLVSRMARFVPYNMRPSRPRYIDPEALIDAEMDALQLTESGPVVPEPDEPEPDEPEPAGQDSVMQESVGQEPVVPEPDVPEPDEPEPAGQESVVPEPDAQKPSSKKRKPIGDITMVCHSYGLRSLKRTNKQE